MRPVSRSSSIRPSHHPVCTVLFLLAAALGPSGCGASDAPQGSAPPHAPGTSPGAADTRAVFPREWFSRSKDDRVWAGLMSEQGMAAPDLRGTVWVGEKEELSAVRGRIVVLAFWATWCPHCRKAAPRMNDWSRRYEDKGVCVIGVCDTQGAESMAEVSQRRGLRFSSVADTGHATEQAYNVQWWPFYVLVDRAGAVRAAGLSGDHVSDAVDALLQEQPGT